MSSNISGSLQSAHGTAGMRPLTVRIREACRLTGISRSKFYELIAEGEIEIVKLGSITLVPVAGLERFLERLKT